jgi:hypothetical protein
MRPVVVAPTVDRSVLGIMVDFAKILPYFLEPGRWTINTLATVEERLAETPCHATWGGNRVICPNQRAPELLHARWLDTKSM